MQGTANYCVTRAALGSHIHASHQHTQGLNEHTHMHIHAHRNKTHFSFLQDKSFLILLQQLTTLLTSTPPVHMQWDIKKKTPSTVWCFLCVTNRRASDKHHRQHQLFMLILYEAPPLSACSLRSPPKCRLLSCISCISADRRRNLISIVEATWSKGGAGAGWWSPWG